MIKKSEVINAVKTIPEKFSLEDFMDKIILLQKIDIGNHRMGKYYLPLLQKSNLING